MSRIGRKIIEVPKGVEVKINGHHVSVKGPLGTLENEFHSDVDIVMECSERAFSLWKAAT